MRNLQQPLMISVPVRTKLISLLCFFSSFPFSFWWRISINLFDSIYKFIRVNLGPFPLSMYIFIFITTADA